MEILEMKRPKTIEVSDLTFELFLSKEEIQKRIGEMGSVISSDFETKKPLFIAILNGAFVFAADLVRHFEYDCEFTFVKLSSYSGTESSGKVLEIIGLDISIENRHVIIVEDIVDTGNTICQFLSHLETQKPASVSIATLLLKPEMLKHDLHPNYIGFEIPPKFVIGFGLDYNGLGRNLPDIYQLMEKNG